MKPARFEYCRVDTVEEALALLGELGPDAALLAGGMSLGPMLNMRLARPEMVIDLNRVPGLDAVRGGDDVVSTGALLRQADAMRARDLMDRVPLLAEALPSVGHFQTRNRGTLGGSVAHADPSAEIPLCLATLGGEVVLRSSAGERRLVARDFFQGILTTAREPDEMVTALSWPARGPRAGHAFEEIAERRGDFAIAAVAAVAAIDGAGNIGTLSLGLGGIEDRPIVADTASFLGAPAIAATADRVAAAAAEAVDPMEDPHASAEYRRQLVRVLGARVLARAFARAQEDGRC